MLALDQHGPAKVSELKKHTGMASTVVSQYLQRCVVYGIASCVMVDRRDRRYTAVKDWMAIADRHHKSIEPPPAWPEIPHQVTVQEWPQEKTVTGPHNLWKAA